MVELFTFNEKVAGSTPVELIMSRSIWKGPIVQKRSTTITTKFIGKLLAIHNGKFHKLCSITNNHVGMKIGEFSPTTVTAIYKKS